LFARAVEQSTTPPTVMEMTHQALTTPPPPTAFEETARWAGIGEDLIAAARTTSAPRLVVSGRLASGKDTVAEAAMAALGRHDAVRVSFATALRAEVDELLDRARTTDRTDLRAAVVNEAGVARTDEVIDLIETILRTDPNATSYQRTREIRLLLQVWGTDIRRAQDPAYWTKQGIRALLGHLATNRPVYVTDARFVDEVELTKSLGCVAVRLEVPSEVRAARLWARDGLQIDPVAENHPSERELEAYRGFDLWVDNSADLANAVHMIVAALRERAATY
jgi:dephospho-CoA kinase